MLSPIKIGTTLTSTINCMTRGFDVLTLTYYKTKQCDHDKDNVKYISLSGVKITPD